MKKIGVAISTTGEEHRLGFLETCVEAWREALPLGNVLYVTVDGDEETAKRVAEVINPAKFGNVVQVGQRPGHKGRLGVAVNKNTGLELLMDTGCHDLFLCDDDTWPLSRAALHQHTRLGIPHSIVCWGQSRLIRRVGKQAHWKWPRGVVLYTERHVIEAVGGMNERFGPGGHEHVEWSQRISNAGFTETPFISPADYALDRSKGARRYWNAEDMPRENESLTAHADRKKATTTIHRSEGEWARLDALMQELEGSTAFVPFRARENGRLSDTLSQNL